jgi:hypothetical protein
MRIVIFAHDSVAGRQRVVEVHWEHFARACSGAVARGPARRGDLVLQLSGSRFDPDASALRDPRRFQTRYRLAMAPGCAPLLGAIGDGDSGIVLGADAASPVAAGAHRSVDWCLDFTGTDRSALATAASRAATTRVAWVQRSMRALAYTRLPIRGSRRHTVDHYLDLVRAARTRKGLSIRVCNCPQTRALQQGRCLAKRGSPAHSSLCIRAPRVAKILAPGTLGGITDLGMPCVDWRTGCIWREHIANSRRASCRPRFQRATRLSHCRVDPTRGARPQLRHRRRASCCGFQRPQIALLTNQSLYWRPRHGRAVVFRGTTHAPLREFTPRMKGAPMDRIDRSRHLCYGNALSA